MGTIRLLHSSTKEHAALRATDEAVVLSVASADGVFVRVSLTRDERDVLLESLVARRDVTIRKGE